MVPNMPYYPSRPLFGRIPSNGKLRVPSWRVDGYTPTPMIPSIWKPRPHAALLQRIVQWYSNGTCQIVVRANHPDHCQGDHRFIAEERGKAPTVEIGILLRANSGDCCCLRPASSPQHRLCKRVPRQANSLYANPCGDLFGVVAQRYRADYVDLSYLQ